MSPDKSNLELVDWIDKKDRMHIIAGPCSAESEAQVLATARILCQIPQVKVFRAGIWKPRTRPNSFEGVGVAGLEWLQTVRQETGLATAVEVANANHVHAALKFGIDIVWVGARTSANPFSVQEIADALQGVDITVWVKNPVNPDLQLWIGAIERINNAGVKRLGAIHRGFTSYEKMAYRNAPRWGIPIELKRFAPDLPLICDPSHIAGDTSLLQTLAQSALDLTMNGLMIETHPDPANALSDSQQQIKPQALTKLLTSLKVRDTNGADHLAKDELIKLRQKSNAIDHELIEALARRMQVVRQIGEYKKKQNMTILQVKRWEQVIEDRVEKGQELGLSQEFVRDIYQLLHNYAIHVQSEVINR